MNASEFERTKPTVTMQKINDLSQLAAQEYEKETGLSADLATFNKR